MTVKQIGRLEFGRSPYDLCPDVRKPFHVIDSDGFIVAKYEYGHTGESDAFSRSDKNPGIEYRVVNTRNGEVYVRVKDGEEF